MLQDGRSLDTGTTTSAVGKEEGEGTQHMAMRRRMSAARPVNTEMGKKKHDRSKRQAGENGRHRGDDGK